MTASRYELTPRRLRTLIALHGERCVAALRAASREPDVVRRDRYMQSAAYQSSSAFAFSARLGKLAAAAAGGSNDEHGGVTWFNALTPRERAEWLAVAGSARPVDAWNAFRRRYPDIPAHRAFLEANVLRAPHAAATSQEVA